jgi:signal transduction histidine kinase
VRRLLVSIIAAVALVVVGAGVILTDAIRRYATRDMEVRLRSIAVDLLAGLTFDADGTAVLNRLPQSGETDERFSGWYWQIKAGDETIARSRSLLLENLPEPQGPAALGPGRAAIRVISISRSVGDPPRAVTAIVAGPQQDIDDAVASEVRFLVISLSVVLAALIAATSWLLLRGLAPLQRMGHDLTAMLEGSGSLLSLTGYRELDRLGAVINRMVVESRRSIEENRERVNKLAHALKTPLALIAARTESSGARPDPDILASVDVMRRHIEHNLRRARIAGPAQGIAVRVPIAPVVDDLMFAFAHTNRDRKLDRTVAIEPGLCFLGERDDLLELLGNILDNAHRFARSSVTLSARRRDDRLIIEVGDDGPGFPESPPIEGSGSGSDFGDGPGAHRQGVGLTIAREIVTAYGGSLSVERNGDTGALVRIDMPA